MTLKRPELDLEFKNFIQLIVTKPKLEGAWLSMLSSLEFIGVRKIVRTHNFEKMDLAMLMHLKEEASHAAMLKQVAVEGFNETSLLGDHLFSKAGFIYFHQLEKGVQAVAQNESQCYSLVSWIIERRVMPVYEYYLTQTRHSDVKQSIRSILGDERKHEVHFENAVPENFATELIELEQRLWKSLVHQLVH